MSLQNYKNIYIYLQVHKYYKYGYYRKINTNFLFLKTIMYSLSGLLASA